MQHEATTEEDVASEEANGQPPAPRRALRRRLVLRGGRVVEVSAGPPRETR